MWFWAIALIVVWLIAMMFSWTLGGFIHLLLVLAVVLILIKLLRRAAD